MSETRTVEVSVKQLIAVVVILILIGVSAIAFVTRDTWLQFFQLAEEPAQTVPPTGNPA